jgi:hypothetical protein
MTTNKDEDEGNSKIEILTREREKIREVLKKYKNGKIKKESLSTLVRKIETLQREYDKESGFSEAQTIIHDFYIKVPTDENQIGCITSDTMQASIETLKKIFNITIPTAELNMKYKLVGIASGSTALVYDIFDKKTDSRIDTEEIIAAKQKYEDVISGATKLLNNQQSENAIQEFKTETGIDEKYIYEIAKSLESILPSKNDEYTTIEIGIPGEKKDDEKKVTIDPSKKACLSKNRATLYNKIKPEDSLIVTGKLAIMEEWDVNHKISIYSEDTAKVCTVNYEPTDENLKKIKENIGKEVSIRKMEDVTDHRKWILAEWL